MAINDLDIKILDSALKLKNEFKYSEALSLLLPLVNKYIEEPKFLLVLSIIYYKKKNFTFSAKYLNKLIKLRPDSELPSLMLFHCYADLEKYTLALKEMDRYLSADNKVDLYLTTLEEQFEQLDESVSYYLREIVTKYYNKYNKQ